MLLIDAIYINNSGGKVLLDYLIEEIEKTEIPVFYLLDSRIFKNHPSIKSSNKIAYCNATLLKRHLFYKKNKKNFNKVLCFGNIPPSIKLEIDVFTYFHQPLFIETPKSISLFNKLKIKIKTIILDLLKNNTNYWLVQSNNVKYGLCEKYHILESHVVVLPFYSTLVISKEIVRNKFKFIFISNTGIHKNHIKLIEAFCKFYDENKKGILGLTVPSFSHLENNLIQSLILKGYPIENYGFIDRNKLAEIYASAEYLIFPSLAESFGLGLVEAIDAGCKVIGANLPYMHAVCEPSILFDPYSLESIKEAFEMGIEDNVRPTIKKVKNEIDTLIDLLK